MNAFTRRFLPEIVVAALTAVYGIGFAFGSYGGVVEGLALVGSVAVVPAVRQWGGDWAREVRLLFAASLAIGVVSIVTGLGNNTTDEPFTMWGYLAVLLKGQDPYTTAASISFTARTIGIVPTPISAQFHYTYLPLLLFFQVPGTGATGYKAMCLACWVGTVYLVRRDKIAALCLATPVAALVSANGFTDLPVLLVMTFSVRGVGGIPGRAAEYASYAMKQFANLFWFVLYVARRDVLRAGMVIVVTLVLCSPFILWHPTGIWCEALTFSLSPGCASAPNASGHLTGLYLHWNYYLWVLWVYALYETGLRGWWKRASRWLGARFKTGDVPG